MLLVLAVAILKQESVSLVTSKTTATAVIPGSGLVQEGYSMTPTHAVTKQRTHQIMATNTSKSWDTSWCSDKKKKNKSGTAKSTTD